MTVEATLDPGTLALVRLEVEFRPGADPSRYVTGARAIGAGPRATNNAARQPPVQQWRAAFRSDRVMIRA